MELVQALSQAASPWASFYNNSVVAQTVVAFGHFGGMMTAGGFAVATDRATIRATRADGEARRRHLPRLRAAHRTVLTGLAVTAISGVLMLAADVEALVASPAFGIKMGLFVLLLANGYLMTRLAGRLELAGEVAVPAWARLRYASAASLVLWFAVVLAGSALRNSG